MFSSTPADSFASTTFPQQVKLLYSGAFEALLATTINAPVLAYIQRDVISSQVLGWWLLYMATVTTARASRDSAIADSTT